MTNDEMDKVTADFLATYQQVSNEVDCLRRKSATMQEQLRNATTKLARAEDVGLSESVVQLPTLEEINDTITTLGERLAKKNSLKRLLPKDTD